MVCNFYNKLVSHRMRHLKRPPVNTLKEITSKTGSKCQLRFCSYFLFANPQLAFSATSIQNLALSVRNVTSMAIFDLEQERKLAKLFMLPIAVRSTSSLHILRSRRNHIPFKRAGCCTCTICEPLNAHNFLVLWLFWLYFLIRSVTF
jgi:hypothetical protein